LHINKEKIALSAFRERTKSSWSIGL